MSFDPELFGQAMGEAIRKAVEPLYAEIESLQRQLSVLEGLKDGKDGRDGKDGKDCDMEQVRSMVEQAVKAIPAPENGKDGKDGADGKDGKSITLDDVQPIIEKAVALICEDAEKAIEEYVKAIPTPKDGRDGRDGVDGKDGKKGDDGTGMADLLIDRDGMLVATYTDGRMKSLGQVVGKDGTDGRDGKDGVDGIGLDNFELEYLPETHEIAIKAQAGIRVKEVRYPAGGIRPGGYWRQGGEAKAGEAWTHDGSLWVARKDTKATPSTQSDEWVLMARKGRDGERGPRGKDGSAPAPIKLKDEDDEPDND